MTFSAEGVLQQSSKKIALTLAGIDVSDFKELPEELTIEGYRVGIRLDGDVPQRVKLQPVTIRIKHPGDGDYAPALNAIFAEDLSDMGSSAPSYWQSYLSQHFPAATVRGRSQAAPVSGTGKSFGAAKRAPHREDGSLEVLEIMDPDFVKLGAPQVHSGVSPIGIDVDPTGHPINPTIAKPVGMGVDEAAIAIVLSKYKFKPAMQNGVAVTYHVNIEINFKTE